MAVGSQKAKREVLWEGGGGGGVEHCLVLLEAKQMED